MISKKMQDALNKQVNAELYSAYLYLSMESYFRSKNMNGFANWMRVQTQEEMSHVMKFYDFINDRGGRVKLAGMNAPKTEWNSPIEVFEDTYEHECKVSSLIYDLVDLAAGENNHPAATFLQWFVTEQVEEEANVDDIIQKLKLTEEAKGALFLMDKDMGTRVFVPPTTE